MSKSFFPQRSDSIPKIYAYEDTNPQYSNLLKVGYTTIDVKARVEQQYPTKRPGKLPYRILLEESAMRNDGTSFTDHEVHRCLRNMGVQNPEGEWFACSINKVKSAIVSVRDRKENEENRTLDFTMRPEQVDALKKTAAYFHYAKKEEPDKTPHFLWNAKMRFGKTFAAYQLAKKMNWNKILVLTFKPAVEHSWESDLKQHVDFEGWQFISPNNLNYEDIDTDKPFFCFGSFQDYLGKNKSTGGIKTKNEWVHSINWDCVILDEYHFGAWRDRAKGLFLNEDDKEVIEENKSILKEAGFSDIDFNEEMMPITTDHYLYLSGTPFRAIASGEFIEDQIFNWTYSDEQKAKEEWKGVNNPYACLPLMVLMTYQLPEAIRDIALQGEFDEFDLNVFFSAEGKCKEAKFKYENEVQKWLNLIRGAFQATTIDNLKMGAKKPPFPYSDVRLLNVLSHTFWFLPNVASCYAMRNLMEQRQNSFYHSYEIIVSAGPRAGIGADALPPVLQKMDDPLKSKTITLSCGKLTTGVTVRPWTGIFMLRNSSSPETYFQAAFRVQSPWTITNPDGLHPNDEEIIKKECYIFDFAPDRALRQIADYSCLSLIHI